MFIIYATACRLCHLSSIVLLQAVYMHIYYIYKRVENHNYMQTITYAWGTLRRWTNSAVQADETTVARPGRRWGVAQKWCCFGACCLSMYSVRRSENRKRHRQAEHIRLTCSCSGSGAWGGCGKGHELPPPPLFFLVAAEEGRKEGQPKRHDSDGSTTTATAPGASHLDRLWLLAKARQSA